MAHDAKISARMSHRKVVEEDSGCQKEYRAHRICAERVRFVCNIVLGTAHVGLLAQVSR